MKTKHFLSMVLTMTALLGCSLFDTPTPAPAQSEPDNNNPIQDNTTEAPEEVSTAGWFLPDPAVGLDSLESYHQQLTISFRGTREGADYEWTNTHQRDIWDKGTANFTTLILSETGLDPDESLVGNVDQAYYSRRAAGGPCDVRWGEVAQDADLAFEPAGFLPAIDQVTEAGSEIVNEIPARHYVFGVEGSGAKIAGDVWLAEPGGYVLRYVLTYLGGESVFGEGLEGEKRFEYELSQVNARSEVVYPEGCAAVLRDFPVMDGARDLQRLPEAVDYTAPAGTGIAAINQFYQDRLAAQGWAFAKAHDKDPQNVVLLFINKEQGKSASILLSAGDSGVWVSAILRPWESTSFEFEMPDP